MEKIDSFTAIDFETAESKRYSICQIGLVQVVSGQIAKEINLLVKPPANFYSSYNIAVHGITPSRTAKSPTFDLIWPEIEPYISGQAVVAHNGFGFDFSCLKQVLELYHIPVPNYDKHCTYKLWGDKLDTLCRLYKIPLNHHDALSDARACASLFLLHPTQKVEPKKKKLQ